MDAGVEVINPHKPGDSLECCEDGCDSPDKCSCGACQCEVCSDADATTHYLDCDQTYYVD